MAAAKGFAHEFRRKLFHLLLGAVIIILFGEGLLRAWMLALVLALGILVSAVHHFRHIPFIHYFLVRFDRDEMIPGRGAMTFIAGMTLVAFAFPKAIALAAMASLAVADAAGALIGMPFGKFQNPLNRKKSVEGSLAVLVASFLACWPFVGAVPAYAGALAAMVVEALSPADKGAWWHILLDDNLLVPIAVGLVLAAIAIV